MADLSEAARLAAEQAEAGGNATFLDQYRETSLIPDASAKPQFTPARATVKVFVRLGDSDGERTIGFRIPDGMDPMDLLDRGATIDGNQAVMAVAWDQDAPGGNEHQGGAYTCPDLNEINTGKWTDDFYGRSMTRVLGDCQRGLVRFFRERGYTVQFA